MEKYKVLSEVADKLKALDNEVKLKILALLVEEGAKSITDISKDLNINFSTAHKYLEQLEKAKLVTSKQVADNRLKRLFYVKDFGVDLSPAGIANLLAGTKKKEKTSFKVINEHGEVVNFDEKLFAQKYLKRGLPRGLISYALSCILEQSYDGITLIELRELFQKALENRAESINDVLDQLDEAQRHKRTFQHLLAVVHPEALEQHARGDIFIKHLRRPTLLNFVHDMRGIYLHSVTGKKVENIKEFSNQLTAAIKKSSSFVKGVHAFDSLNFMIAPLVKNMPARDLNSNLKALFTSLDKLNIPIFISVDAGSPKYTKFMSPTYFAGKTPASQAYSHYQEEANLALSEILKIFKENKFENISLIYKIWNKKFNEKDVSGLKNIYLANMLPDWQALNASYVGEFSRFDGVWKKWLGTVRCGEIQDIVLNLPRLALKAKTENEFFKELKILMQQAIGYVHNLSELAIGEFLRKYDTHFKSVQRGYWNYVPSDDFKYSISVTGLNDTVKILSGKPIEKNEKLAKKILKFCNDVLQPNSKRPLFRVLLKEDTTKVIANRFHFLDSKNYKTNIKEYSPGIGGDLQIQLGLHELLPGGHCSFVPRKELKSALKKNFGLIKLI